MQLLACMSPPPDMLFLYFSETQCLQKPFCLLTRDEDADDWPALLWAKSNLQPIVNESGQELFT